ncbi:MAG: hypothetical protein ABIB79_01880 [archaeon]
MVKKCLYCGCELSEESVIDFCERCGIGNFGKKIFDTLKHNMENARKNGDLCHQNNFSNVSDFSERR